MSWRIMNKMLLRSWIIKKIKEYFEKFQYFKSCQKFDKLPQLFPYSYSVESFVYITLVEFFVTLNRANISLIIDIR